MNIKIIVAAHKPYRMPDDPMYLPLHVGHVGKSDLGWQGDDSGDNISHKNTNYCELTGLYWAWKNLDADVIGLAHYRRHFMGMHTGTFEWILNTFGLNTSANKWTHILTQAQVEIFLEQAPGIVASKRNYFIESVASQYAHAHHREDLALVRTVIFELFPEYLPAFDELMLGTQVHLFNMFIMHRSYLDAYCTWLFNILFELENRLDISGYTQNDARVFGFLGERLLDVWLNTSGIQYQECPIMFMERQNLVKKVSSFIIRKVRNR